MDINLSVVLEILEKNKIMTLASSTKNGSPWISPLYFAYDNNLHLYWSSAKNAMHSQLIEENPTVAVTVYNEPMAEKPNWDCVFLRGEAAEVQESQFPQALNVYYKRGHPILTEDAEHPLYAKHFLGDSPRRLYKFTPNEAYILNPPIHIDGHIFDSRIKVDLFKPA